MIRAIDTNQNGEVEFTEVFDFIISCMKDANTFKSMDSGEKKKTYVMNKICELLPRDAYERYYPMLDRTIDFLVYVSKHPKLLKGVTDMKKLCFSKFCVC